MSAQRAKVESFEDLHIFQQARVLVTQVYELTRSGLITKDYALVDRMRRAAISILSNIAEEFERQTDVEFARSLFIAKGSGGELRAQVLIARDQKYVAERDYEAISSCCRRTSAGVYNLISCLRHSRSTPEEAKT